MLKFPLLEQLPPEFDGVVYDFWWDIEKLTALELPRLQVPVSKLWWHLDLPWWRYNDKPFQATPIQVLNDPIKYREQYERTLAADLAYPVFVRNVDDGMIIIDGIHRLLKAVINNVTELEGRLFSDEQIPLILHEEA